MVFKAKKSMASYTIVCDILALFQHTQTITIYFMTLVCNQYIAAALSIST